MKRGILGPIRAKVAEMLQNLLDNRSVINDTIHFHITLALGTYQGINLANSLDYARPVPAGFAAEQP